MSRRRLLAVALLVAACGRGAPTPVPVIPVIPTTIPAWAPAGYIVWPADPGIAYQATDNPTCVLDRCYGIEVVTRSGCPASLYAEVAVLDATSAQIGYSNDTTSGLRAGEHAKLVFDITEDDAKKVRVTEITCY